MVFLPEVGLESRTSGVQYFIERFKVFLAVVDVVGEALDRDSYPSYSDNGRGGFEGDILRKE